MAEPHASADRHQSCRLGGKSGIGREAKAHRRAAKQRGFAERLRGGDAKEHPGFGWKLLEMLAIELFDTTRDRERGWKRESAGERVGRHAPWPVDERERVSLGLRDDAVEHLSIHRSGDPRRQQFARVGSGKTIDLESRAAVELLADGLSNGDENPHSRQAQPSPDEREDRDQRAPEPAAVADGTTEATDAPGAPSRTSTWLRPVRTAANNRSKASRSARRPRSMGQLPRRNPRWSIDHTNARDWDRTGGPDRGITDATAVRREQRRHGDDRHL